MWKRMIFSLLIVVAVIVSIAYATNNSSEIIVVFDESDLKILNANYGDKEAYFCLYSSIHSDDYIYVDRITIPLIEYNNYSYIRLVDYCEDNEFYVGNLHTHPSGNCEFSERDRIHTFFDYALRGNKSIVAGLMCGKNKFVWERIP